MASLTHSDNHILNKSASPIPLTVILKVSEYTGSIVTCLPSSALSCSSTTVPPLHEFIQLLVERSRINQPTFIASFIYINRLHKKLPSTARGMYCTCHRIYLASLLLAGKYLSDSPIKNRSWATYASFFSLAEINLMERQFLLLLDYNLRISVEELENLAIEYGIIDNSTMHFDDALPPPAIESSMSLSPSKDVEDLVRHNASRIRTKSHLTVAIYRNQPDLPQHL
jgi:hypothetical protein